MQEASLKNPGTLMVALGAEVVAIEKVLTPFQEQGMRLWIANLNCPGQVVIAGEKAAFHVVEPVLKASGVKKLLPLDVSGAFHSPLMKSAEEKLKPFIEKAPIHSSSIRFLSNVSGDFTENPLQIKDNLVRQVTSPTKWQKEIEAMDNAGVELFIEIGPGKTLSGMNRKIGPKAPTVSIDKLADFSQLEEMMVRAS